MYSSLVLAKWQTISDSVSSHCLLSLRSLVQNVCILYQLYKIPTYFLFHHISSGNNIWRFFGKQLEPGFPRPKRNSFPHSTDAALIDEGKIYILKGGRYYEFFENELNIGWSKKIRHHWGGIPANINAALQGRNGTTYFFKNDNYWRFEDSKMVGAYRKSRSKDWIGCGSF